MGDTQAAYSGTETPKTGANSPGTRTPGTSASQTSQRQFLSESSDPNPTLPPDPYKWGKCCFCFNVPLQKACTIISISGIVLGVILAVSGILVFALQALIQEYLAKRGYSEKLANVYVEGLGASALVQITRGIYSILLYIILYVGVLNRDRTTCIRWAVTQIVVILLTIILGIVVAILFPHPEFILCPLILYIIELYFLCIVLLFIKELKVVGVVEGAESKKVKDGIMDSDISNLGISGPGTASGEQVNPPKYYPKTLDISSQDGSTINSGTSSVTGMGSGGASTSTIGLN